MKRCVALLLFLLVVSTQAAPAQTLTPQMRHGRQLLNQNCNVCQRTIPVVIAPASR